MQYTVSEAPWTLIQEKLHPQTNEPYTVDILGGHTPAMSIFCGFIKRQKFATGIFKTEFMSCLDKNKK